MKGTITVLSKAWRICDALGYDKTDKDKRCAGLYGAMFVHVLRTSGCCVHEVKVDVTERYEGTMVVDAPDDFFDSEIYKLACKHAEDVFETAKDMIPMITISTKKSILVRRFSNANAVDHAELYYTLLKYAFTARGNAVHLSDADKYDRILPNGGSIEVLDFADKVMRTLLGGGECK